MIAMNNQDYLKIAIQAAKACGPMFKKTFGNAPGVTSKNNDPANLVTETDKAIELKIRKMLNKNFPSHKIIGEEFSKDVVGKKDFVWAIDPIDGTTNYIHGLPFCCISIGLWDGQGPLVAALYNPLLKQLFTAIRGKGAWLNQKPIKTSNQKKLKDAFGALGWMNMDDGIKLFADIVKNSRRPRVLASSALQICLVASGNLDYYATTDVKIWDFAAAVLVLTEAGGQVSDLRGRRPGLKTEKIVASNGKIHSQLLKALR